MLAVAEEKQVINSNGVYFHKKQTPKPISRNPFIQVINSNSITQYILKILQKISRNPFMLAVAKETGHKF